MSRRAMVVAALSATVFGLGACGGDDGAPGASADGAPATSSAAAPQAASSTPGGSDQPTSPAQATPPSSSGTPPAGAPAVPSTPADAPSPSGATPDAASKAGKRPRSREGRVQADNTAMLNVRTMVSIIESCHSGQDTYKACNTHDELGDPSLLGLTIGKKRGQVQVSATDNGFRITGHSMSGAKFTVARGPKGDRFKCVQGRMPGACPADRVWSF